MEIYLDIQVVYNLYSSLAALISFKVLDMNDCLPSEAGVVSEPNGTDQSMHLKHAPYTLLASSFPMTSLDLIDLLQSLSGFQCVEPNSKDRGMHLKHILYTASVSFIPLTSLDLISLLS